MIPSQHTHIMLVSSCSHVFASEIEGPIVLVDKVVVVDIRCLDVAILRALVLVHLHALGFHLDVARSLGRGCD